jgi:toxin ParE1/3/4
LQAHFEPLRHFPLSGPARPALAPNLRVTFHRRYAIYYRPQRDTIVIVRVLHSARDVAAIAAGGGMGGMDF